jgi:anti-repressor protein
VNELITIDYSGNNPTVLARDLHVMLEVRSKYADWFKNMCEYGFAEGRDYLPFSKILENGGRAIDSSNYAAMRRNFVAPRTEREKQAQQYS